MPTVLITGCSSGFGLETARLFLQRGWNVVATMRNPHKEVLPESDALRILPLDVTDASSIGTLVEEAGEIDVLVNNAGIGAVAPIELTDAALARQLFDTNMLGTLSVMRAYLPTFRERRSGTIINVTSAVTLKPLPLVSVYRASKAAVDALTASLAVEMEPFGVRVHMVLPGRSPATSFGENAAERIRGADNQDYAPMIQEMMSGFQDNEGPVTHAGDVAEAVWEAATDPDAALRIAAGDDAVKWMTQTT